MKERITQQFVASLKTYRETEIVPTMSDLYIRYDEKAGDATLFDDLEEEIFRISLPKPIASTRFIEVIGEVLRTKEFGQAIEQMEVLKPFSVILVDDKFDHLQELITFDDENIIIDDSFLNQYNNDLDQFLKHLMEE